MSNSDGDLLDYGSDGDIPDRKSDEDESSSAPEDESDDEAKDIAIEAKEEEEKKDVDSQTSLFSSMAVDWENMFRHPPPSADVFGESGDAVSVLADTIIALVARFSGGYIRSSVSGGEDVMKLDDGVNHHALFGRLLVDSIKAEEHYITLSADNREKNILVVPGSTDNYKRIYVDDDGQLCLRTASDTVRTVSGRMIWCSVLAESPQPNAIHPRLLVIDAHEQVTQKECVRSLFYQWDGEVREAYKGHERLPPAILAWDHVIDPDVAKLIIRRVKNLQKDLSNVKVGNLHTHDAPRGDGTSSFVTGLASFPFALDSTYVQVTTLPRRGGGSRKRYRVFKQYEGHAERAERADVAKQSRTENWIFELGPSEVGPSTTSVKYFQMREMASTQREGVHMQLGWVDVVFGALEHIAPEFTRRPALSGNIKTLIQRGDGVRLFARNGRWRAEKKKRKRVFEILIDSRNTAVFVKPRAAVVVPACSNALAGMDLMEQGEIKFDTTDKLVLFVCLLDKSTESLVYSADGTLKFVVPSLERVKGQKAEVERRIVSFRRAGVRGETLKVKDIPRGDGMGKPQAGVTFLMRPNVPTWQYSQYLDAGGDDGDGVWKDTDMILLKNMTIGMQVFLDGTKANKFARQRVDAAIAQLEVTLLWYVPKIVVDEEWERVDRVAKRGYRPPLFRLQMQSATGRITYLFMLPRNVKQIAKNGSGGAGYSDKSITNCVDPVAVVHLCQESPDYNVQVNIRGATDPGCLFEIGSALVVGIPELMQSCAMDRDGEKLKLVSAKNGQIEQETPMYNTAVISMEIGAIFGI